MCATREGKGQHCVNWEKRDKGQADGGVKTIPSLSGPPSPAAARPLPALTRQRVAGSFVASARIRVRLQVRPQHLDVGTRDELREALRDGAGHQLAHRQDAVRELRGRDKVVDARGFFLGVDRALPEELGDEGVAF